MRKKLHPLIVIGLLIALPALACNALTPDDIVSTPSTTAKPPIVTEFVDNLPLGGCPENLGKIAFSYDPEDLESRHFGIYIMNSDGSDRRLVSSPDEIHAMEPAWSPERCRIVYKSFTSEGNDDIYVITADGKSVRQLTTDPSWDVSPDWSPDGTKISFLSDRDGFLNLYVMNADGSNVQQVTQYKEKGMSWTDWSPTGDEIAFDFHSTPSDGIPSRIFGIHPDGTGLRQLVGFDGEDSAVEPAWSPDGKKLYFISNRSGDLDIWEINIDGSGLHQVSNFNHIIDYTHSLHVSPDGTQLAFYGVSQDVTEHGQEIFVINVDGSGLTDITHSTGREEWLDW
jgi:Tol biopolymer transport system component